MRTLPRLSSITLAGLRSRCRTPSSWAAANARAQLPRNLDGFVLRQAPNAAQQRGQVLAVHILHGEKGQAGRFSDVKNTADVGMRDLPRQPHFAVKPGQHGAILRHRLRQELHGDGLAQAQVVGTVDLAHAAFAQQSHDAISLCENLAGNKTPFIEGGRVQKIPVRGR